MSKPGNIPGCNCAMNPSGFPTYFGSGFIEINHSFFKYTFFDCSEIRLNSFAET